MARRRIAFCAVFAFGLTPSGCSLIEPIPNPNISVRYSEAGPEFAVCVDIAIQFASASVLSNSQEWTYMWKDTDLNLRLEAGDTFTGDSIDPAWSVTEEPQLQPGEKVDVLLKSAGDKTIISGRFLVPEDGLPTSEWLHTDKTTSSEPCV